MKPGSKNNVILKSSQVIYQNHLYPTSPVWGFIVWSTLSIALYSILDAFCVSWKDLMHTTSLPAAVLNRNLICPFVSVSPATYSLQLKPHLKENFHLLNHKFKNKVRNSEEKKIDTVLGIRKEVSSNSSGFTFYIYQEVNRFDNK